MSNSVDQTRWSVAVLCPLPEQVLQDLAEHFQVVVNILDEKAKASDFRAALTGHQWVLTSINAPLPAPVIEAFPPSIRAIATYSVGHEHIDLAAAQGRGLPVFYTPEALTEAVAEVALFLMLGAARRASESIALLRSRQWKGWAPTQLNAVELWHKRLGIFGMGRIGRAIAVRAQAFGMKIHYCNRHRLPPELEGDAQFHGDLEAMLALSDVLVLASPSTAETRGVLNAHRILALKPGAIVVNIARGDLVVDDALIAALTSGRVRAAGLDVFNNEPAIERRYYDLPNVFMLPHIGSATLETRRRMGRILADGIMAWRRGETPRNRLV